MNTKKIKITAQITVTVPNHLSKEELEKIFNNADIRIAPKINHPHYWEFWDSNLEIISIEEEAELYNTEE